MAELTRDGATQVRPASLLSTASMHVDTRKCGVWNSAIKTHPFQPRSHWSKEGKSRPEDGERMTSASEGQKRVLSLNSPTLNVANSVVNSVDAEGLSDVWCCLRLAGPDVRSRCRKAVRVSSTGAF